MEGGTAGQTFERIFTWEEVSWITGIPICQLLEIYGQYVASRELAPAELPVGVDAQTINVLAEPEAAPVHAG